MTENKTTGAKPTSTNRSYGPPRAEATAAAAVRPAASAPTATYPAPAPAAAPTAPPAPAAAPAAPVTPPPAPQAPQASHAPGSASGSMPGLAQRQPGGGPSRPSLGGGGSARTRRAYLRLARIDPWTVMKVSFVLSIALAIVTVVAIAIVWLVLDALGVFSSLNSTLGDISGSGTGGTSNTFVSSYLSFGHVLGYTLLLALVDIVLVTAISTLAAYLYNIATRFVGGLELTLTDDH